jgi:fructose-bisphosphate aldolase, class I
MSTTELQHTIEQIAQSGKGILAADESHNTIAKRFAAINVENTEQNRCNYREMLLTTPDLSKYISGVILFEETLTQIGSRGKTLGNVLSEQGIIPGIKVDKGLIAFASSPKEKITQGLDSLGERLITYKQQGAKFAKWRAVFTVNDTLPSYTAIHTNAHALARYAAICQQHGIVPIVEPEVLMDGDHTLERCSIVTDFVLHCVFSELWLQKVSLEGMILKPSMVTAGSECPQQADIETVARETVKVLKHTVPAAVPTINFLSGGQSAELATQHLNAMNQLGDTPWQLSFSYGRALQAPSLDIWHGKSENIKAAQDKLRHRAKLNSVATQGKYQKRMED